MARGKIPTPPRASTPVKAPPSPPPPAKAEQPASAPPEAEPAVQPEPIAHDEQPAAERPITRAIYATRPLTDRERENILAVEKMLGDFKDLIDRFGMTPELAEARKHVIEAGMWVVRHITA